MKILSPPQRKLPFLLGISLSSVALTLFLFFIDEGRYTLSDFFDDKGNLFAFIVYCGIFILLHWLIAKTLLKRYEGFKKLLFTFLLMIAILGAFFIALLIGSLG